jgi:amino acid adenylation domain-containing protein
MLEQVEQTLRGMRDGVRYVRDLPLMSAAEEQRLIVEWNETAREYPRACVHELFAVQAARRPEAVAVECGEERLSYGELNRRANRLAHYLRRAGVGAESLVGILMERSIEMMVAILGVLKAGGAYLPLDARYPTSRLAFMLKDAGGGVVLTQERLRGVVGVLDEGVRVVCVDGEWEAIAEQEEWEPEAWAGVENLAYVIYTSGSTGRQKGVMISHGALANYLHWCVQTFKVEEGCGAPVHSSISFDLIVTALLPPLLVGRTVTMLPEGEGVEALGDALSSGRDFSLVKITPTHLEALKSYLQDWEEIMRAKALVVGGEALRGESLAFWRAHAPAMRLFNHYGPTEATVGSCAYEIPSEAPLAGAIPIGRPIANAQVYLLDRNLRPVPVGAAGELYISGSGLARGYLSRPELTAEKFIPHPFSQTPGARLYHTGDVARYLEDGNIEYIARADAQVKIRGYRIELGEIENVLVKHEAVRQAVVRATESEGADKQLIAYVVPDARYLELREETTRAELQAEQVARWGLKWDDTYGETSRATGEVLPVVSCKGESAGSAIPQVELRDWVDQTAQRILRHTPRSVLEIGCGPGALLLRLAPHCRSYVGTDVSSAAVRRAKSQLDASATALSQVTLLHREAHDFEGFADQNFDAVVLNSVVQYFPDANYLARLLERVVERIESEGFIFIGDVRHLRLLEALYASAELEGASLSLPLAELSANVHRRVREEKELCLDHAFFDALKRRIPRITRVEIQLKRGRHHNELTRFRYDALLHVGTGDDTPAARSAALDWKAQNLSLSSVRQLLEDKETEALTLGGVPNARLLSAVKTAELLRQRDGLQTAGDLSAALTRRLSEHGQDPEDFWAVGSELGYTVKIGWSTSGRADEYDVQFSRPSAVRTVRESAGAQAPGASRSGDEPPLSSFANNPLRELLIRKQVPELRDYLRDNLPDYMIPAAFLMLEEIPRTLNGKVNWKALPAHGDERSEVRQSYIAPRDELERQLTQIWEDAINVRPIGVKDNFFDLGGNSLRAIIILGRIQKGFGRQLPAALFFPRIDIETLANVLREEEKPAPISPLLELQPHGSRPPFFCVHAAIGFAFHFAPLARHLGTDQPFYGLQAPGLEHDIEPIREAVEMAARYVEAIRGVQPHGPYYIGGASMGGRVAYEMAQQLRRQGEEIGLLAIFDSVLADDEHRPSRDVMEQVDDATVLASALSEYMKLPVERLRRMTPDEQSHYILEQGRPLNMFPPGFGLKDLQRLLKVFRASSVAWSTYVPQPYAGRVTLFRAAVQRGIGIYDWFLGWENIAPGRVEVHEVPGDHLSIFREPHVRVLARRLADCLATAQS